VKNLDALNGKPVLDIKPVFRECLPMSEIKQPEWVSRMLEKYW
jgi:tRNA (adenine37-N6)-methyltransferase